LHRCNQIHTYIYDSLPLEFAQLTALFRGQTSVVCGKYNPREQG
jgi:hypothetical protein